MEEEVKKYLREIGSKGGRVCGPSKSRKGTGKQMRQFWRDVRAGRLPAPVRKKREAN